MLAQGEAQPKASETLGRRQTYPQAPAGATETPIHAVQFKILSPLPGLHARDVRCPRVALALDPGLTSVAPAGAENHERQHLETTGQGAVEVFCSQRRGSFRNV